MPKIVTLDLECFYSTEYSLTKIPTEEYVRSPQFEMIGIAIKVDDGETVWYPKPQVERILKEFDWSDAMVVAQNTAFDGAVLDWLYGVKPLAWFDTLGMSRALYPHERAHGLAKQAERMGIGAKGDEVLQAKGKHYADFSTEELSRYALYCINDTELTYKLFNMYMAMGFPKQELKLMDMTLRMFIEPVLELDKKLLVNHLEAVRDAKETLMESVRDFMLKDADPEYVHAIFSEGMAGIKKLLMSNDKFSKVLENYGVVPPTKVSLRTGKIAWAFAKTDEEFKLLEEHPDERIQILVAARLGNKTTIEETRTERFIGMSTRGRFPVPLRYYGAHSGRWSGQDSVNLQNLPSRGDNAGKIKKAIKAPAGHVVIDCDSAQIEARTLAWLAGQHDLIEAFSKSQDVYKLMASKIYKIPVGEIDRQQRQVGKVVILGAGYGVGHQKLKLFLKMQAGVDVTFDDAKLFIDSYRRAYYKIPELWRRADEALIALRTGNGLQIDEQGLIRAVPGKGLTLPSGLFIQYPDLAKVMDETTKKDQWRYFSKGVPVYIYGGKVIENICQAVARQVVAEQMLRIGRKYKVVLTVHDAVAIIAKESEKLEAQAYLEECMSWQPKWASGLPLACESGMGASYGDC